MNLLILMPLALPLPAEFEPSAFDRRRQEHFELIVKLVVSDALELRPLILAFVDHFHDAKFGDVAVLVVLFPNVRILYPLALAGRIVLISFEPEMSDGGVG